VASKEERKIQAKRTGEPTGEKYTKPGGTDRLIIMWLRKKKELMNKDSGPGAGEGYTRKTSGQRHVEGKHEERRGGRGVEKSQTSNEIPKNHS